MKHEISRIGAIFGELTVNMRFFLNDVAASFLVKASLSELVRRYSGFTHRYIMYILHKTKYSLNFMHHVVLQKK